MKSTKVIGILFLFCSINSLYAQEDIGNSITLKQAYQWANRNYPLIKDANLIDQIEAVNLDIIKKEGLPSLSVNGRAQYQSENIELATGNMVLAAPLETWNASVNVDYDLYDGGIKKAQKDIEIASANVNRKSLEVQLRNLKDRVNTLVFAIALSRKQEQILQTSIDDIDVNIKTLQSGFENGTVLESEVSKLKVRRLELNTDLIKTKGNVSTYITLLEQLTGKTLPKDVQFITPTELVSSSALAINRPEEELYDSQRSLIAAQEASIAASTMPKISLFAEGGVGSPNPLNFADFNTAPYALAGVKLNWNVINFGKSKKEREKLKIEQDQIEVDRETFLFDLNNDIKEYLEQMETIRLQIENNQEIVALQTDILNQSRVQLDNGIINSSEYITQLNAKLNAENQLELNRVELQQININYLTLIGQL